MVLTSLAALLVLSVAASALVVVSGRAASINFPWPASLTKIFASRTATRLSPAAPLVAPTYYSQGSVDPTVTTNWNTVRAGGGTSPANFTTAGNTFVIQDGNNMTASSVWTVSGSGTTLEIESGGTLTANAAVTIGSTATFQIVGGGTYVHNNASAFGSTILNGTESFASTSTVILNNSNTTGPTGTTFGNLTINFTTDPGGNVQCSGGITSINGNLTLTNTQAREFRLSAATAYTLNLAGDLIVQGGTLEVASSAGAGVARTVNIAGSYNQTGGTVQSSGTSNAVSINFTGTSKTFTQSTGTLTNTNINWAVNSGASLTLANNLPVATTRTATVSGTLNFGTNAVTGAGAFTTSSTATLGIGSADGIDSATTVGNIRVSGTRTFDSATSYNYNGSGNQATGNGLSSTVKNFTVANAGSSGSNTVTLGSTIAVTGGDLSINSGVFDLGSNTANRSASAGTLTVSNGATLKIGGTNTIPSSYATHTLGTSSTVEYSGSTQTVSPETYGFLTTSGSGTKTLGGATTLAGSMTIGSGTTLDVSGSNFGLNVSGNWSNSGSFTPGSGTVAFNGGTAQTLSGNTTFKNLTTDKPGGSLNASLSTLAVTGLLHVEAGTFTSATSYGDVTIDATGTLVLSGSITVSGSWSNSGNFTPGTNGVTFNGATGQTIAGNTSFYDFTKQVGAAQQLNFTNGSTTTVTHALTLEGLTGGNVLSLRSSTPGSQWNLNYTGAGGSLLVDYVDVKDSNASGSTQRITATNSVNSGNNINWFFGCAGTLIVNDTGDAGDTDPGNGVCETAGNVCTLRAAIQEANALTSCSGAIDINFNITPLGLQTIAPASPLPTITRQVNIRGYSQPGAKVNNQITSDNAVILIELNGTGAGAGANGLSFATSDSTVRGLVINRFTRDGISLNGGTGNTISGNFIGTDTTGLVDLGNGVNGVEGEFFTNANSNLIGGLTPADRNIISGNGDAGITFTGARANVIQGNFIGLGADGTTAVGNTGKGIDVAAFTSAFIIGGDDAADGTTDTVVNARNYISGNGASGIFVGGAVFSGATIKGNYIGTDVTGTVARANANGIGTNLATLIVGGTTDGAGNLISGNTGDGLNIGSTGSAVITGNKIGTNAAGTGALANAANGILLYAGSSSTQIGGANAGEANIIAFNTLNGVKVDQTGGTRNVIRGNSIHDNGRLGIDLNVVSDPADGVTDNDDQDPDTGPNDLQNFPVITAAAADTQLITGTLNSLPNNADYTVDFYKNSACDASGNGEGQTYIGSATADSADADGNGTITFQPALGTFSAFDIITATVTDSANNTSEFSACLTATTTAGAAGTIQFAQAEISTLEGTAATTHTVDFLVTRQGGSEGSADVHYDVTDDTATIANDYTVSPASGNFHWDNVDATDRVITITVNGDANYEAHEFVKLKLSNATGATIGSPGVAYLKILNDDNPPANSQTFTVNSTDGADSGACLPSHCPLRDAINAANANDDTNRIEFNIPFDDAGHVYYRDDDEDGQLTGSSLGTTTNDPSTDSSIPDIDPDWPHSWWTIRLEGSGNLPPITYPVTIDGYTQPGAVLNTDPTCQDGILRIELNGINITGGIGLDIQAGGSMVKGLAINRFLEEGPGSGTGIKLSVNGGNTITGNFIGTDISGTLAADDDDSQFGNQIGLLIDNVPGNSIGGPVSDNTNAKLRNLISANLDAGVRIANGGATGNMVQGNFIGTDAHGTSIYDISGNGNNMGNGDAGVEIYDAADNIVGNSQLASPTAAAGAGNVISGNGSFGIEISSGSLPPHGNGVGSNFIGTDLPTHSALLGNGGDGVQLCQDSHNNLIGGTSADFANVIANNGGNGVGVLSSALLGNTIRLNSIYNNDALGIDLGDNGVTANDSMGHTGPNNYQNFPVITSVVVDTGGTERNRKTDGIQLSAVNNTITGTLNSNPGETFTIDFYNNEECDGSGNGEGQTHLGSIVTNQTGVDGNVSFTFNPATLNVGDIITATATDGAGNTSEFSVCFAVVDVTVTVSPPSAVAEDGGSDLVYTFTRSDSTGSLTVYFTASGTADANSDYTVSGMDTTFSPPFGTVTFNAGESTKNVKITPSADTDYEADETVILTVTSGGYNPVAPTSASGTITNDDAPLIVNTTADPGDGVCTADPGGCTLREAINAANSNPNVTGINFNIPTGMGGDPGCVGPACTISPGPGGLPTITETVIIDGYSQPGATPNTNPTADNATLKIEVTGASAGSAYGLVLDAAGCTIKGLVINRFRGACSPQQSDCAGIKILSFGNEINGNFIGTDATGRLAADGGNVPYGNDVGVLVLNGGGNLIGCLTADERNVISGNIDDGVQITGMSASSNFVQSNLIGVKADGTSSLGNGGAGVEIYEGGFQNFIGAQQNNVNNQTLSGANVIAFNGKEGVLITSNPDISNQISQNSIYSNGGLGINLFGGTETNDVTQNDPGDDDTGPNNLQNFPVITSVDVLHQTITGTLNSNPHTADYTIEFFANPACDPSGHGEGKTFLGSVFIAYPDSTDDNGDVSFSLTAPLSPFGNGDVITATATDPSGSTSEFSACFANVQSTTTAITNGATELAVDTVVGEPYTVKWSVTPSGSGTPTGNVTVTVAASTETCTAPVADLQCSITPTSPGTRQLTAGYAGDANFTGSSSSPEVPHIVNKANTTTTITNAAELANPSSTGNSYLVKWTVNVNSPGAGTPTGNVTVNGGSSCSAPVADLQCYLTSTTPGVKSLVASYSGDGNLNPSDSASESHPVNDPVCTPRPAGMVGWWPGDGNGSDISGSGHNGSLQNATFAPGKVSQAFSFDGGTGKLAIPDSPSLALTTSLSIDAWVNVAAYPENVGIILFRGDNRPFLDPYYLVVTGTGNARFHVEDASGTIVNVEAPIPLNQFVHVAGTLDDTTGVMTLYLNGAVAAQTTTSVRPFGTLTGGNPGLGIGNLEDGGTPDQPFNGLIDEVELFDRALTDTQVAAIYNASFAGKCRTCTLAPSGMVSWYPAEGNANDIYGTHNGTLVGDASFVAGEVGQAFTFDGNGDYVNLGNSSDFDLTSAITIDAWIRATQTEFDAMGPDAVIVAKGDTTWRLQRRPGTYSLRFGTNNASNLNDLDGNINVADGQWHHVGATFDGTTKSLYIDGRLDVSVTVSLPIQTSTFNVRIGDNSEIPGRFWKGQIDEVEIFNRALDATDIRAIADAGNKGKCHNSTIQFSSPTYLVNENGVNASITVTRTGAHDTLATVKYDSVTGGTATAGATCTGSADYRTTTGTLNFGVNDVSQTFSVPICDDSVFEGPETVKLQLSNVVGASPGGTTDATLTINDNETAPNITINDVSQAEGSPSGTTNFIFTVTLSTATQSGVTVNYSTQDNTATTAGNDYVGIPNGSLTIANATTGQFTVQVKQDTTPELNETFFVNLTGTTVGTITDTQGTGTILNDDVEVSVAVLPSVVAEDGVPTLVYTFTRNGDLSAPLTVNFSVVGTATFNTDYTESGAGTTFSSSSGTATFGANNATVDVTLDPTPDSNPEADEIVVLTVASGTGYSIGSPGAATGTINDNDPCPTFFTVTDNGDVGDANSGNGVCATAGAVCTLRAAIEEANALTSCGTIDINFSGVTSPINLGSALPALNHKVNINGPGASSLTVSGGGSFRPFSINSGKTVSISGLTISNGNSGSNGGGILNNGTLTLTSVTVSGNSAVRGGGIYSGGGLTMTNSTVSGNTSGSDGAGGIYFQGDFTLMNSTVSGNTSSGSGGGIYSFGSGTLTNCTVSGNNASTSGGGFNLGSGTAFVRNTIIAGNSATTSGPDISSSSSAFNSQGHNLIGKSDGGTGFTNDPTCSSLCDKVGTIASPLEPWLDSLKNNGGTTKTHALLYNSPAIDAGDGCVVLPSGSGGCLATPLSSDQRGLSRQADGDNNGTSLVDIGAYERQKPEIRDVLNGQNAFVDINDVRLTFPCVPSGGCQSGGTKDAAVTPDIEIQPNTVDLTLVATPIDALPGSGPAFDVHPSSSFFAPPATVCFYLPSITNSSIFATLKVYHRENTGLVDRTTQRTFADKTVCAQVDSFSQFVINQNVSPSASNGNVGGQIVDSNGNPVEGAAVRISGTQNRLTVTDAQGNYHFDDVETNGFYTVVPSRANFSFSPSQRSFSALGQHTEAAFNATPTGTGLNPLDATEYFVRQQYLDFLGREPDESGLNFWVNNIESCGADANCQALKRIDTSAAFFLSVEFQQTGYLVYRTYQAAYGDMPSAPVPVKLGEFKPDTAEIGNGVIVNQSGWEQQLDSNKQAYAAEFVQRPRFIAAYPVTMTPDQFVDQLFTNAGVTSTRERTSAISEFGPATTSADAAARGRALLRVAENSILAQQEFNQAFVLMQYFGYLRRDANTGRDTDFSGYTFWLDKLNTFNGNFQNAEMVKAFLVSGEYRGRFPR